MSLGPNGLCEWMKTLNIKRKYAMWDPHKLILKKVVLTRFSDFVQSTKNLEKNYNHHRLFVYYRLFLLVYDGKINDFEKYLTTTQYWSEI